MLAKPLTSVQPLNRFNDWAERQGWAFMTTWRTEQYRAKKCIMHMPISTLRDTVWNSHPLKTNDIA